jgi:putative Mg2+ transporter-C (MgtC) family protein
MLSVPEVLLRIFVAAVLAGAIGFERDIHARTVGFRTHVLVGMAAATFFVVSTQFIFFHPYENGDLVKVDVSRIASSVVTGIGFLAGGAILKSGGTLHGMTTAAGLWLVTSIGLAAGAGMFAVAFVVTVLGLVALTVIKKWIHKDLRVFTITLVFDEGADIWAITTSAAREMDAVSLQVSFAYARAEKRATVELQVGTRLGGRDLVGIFQKEPSIREFRILPSWVSG